MKNKICPHCKMVFEYEIHQKFGAHITNCKSNPKREEIINKASNSRKVERIIYIFNCLKCNKEYTIELKTTDFKKGRYSKYCSRSCANEKPQTEQTKSKISDSIKKYIKNNGNFGILIKNEQNKREKPKCKICGETVKKHENVYCSRECVLKSEYVRQKSSISSIGKNSGQKNGMFGKPLTTVG